MRSDSPAPDIDDAAQRLGEFLAAGATSGGLDFCNC